MDAVTALAAASGDLLRRVQAIQPDQWLVPEVCGAWNTRQLVSHVLNG
ncbi:MAG: hypothetical protein JWL70_3076, partial [Acidimicrobiia bacterium]|nr:hypothetical protein [Acidimicrobiia bacterium]